MKIGDIEYTRKISTGPAVANSSVRAAVSFALGIKLRPLLTRVQAWAEDAAAVTNGQGVFLENGESIATGVSLATLRGDDRAFPLLMFDQALVVEGIPQTQWAETFWWKLLMPDVRLHFVSTVLVPVSFAVVMHYRFAELTNDEVIEVAAQRSQG